MGWCCFGFLFRCFVLGDNYCLYLVANCFLHQDFLFIASFFDLFGAIQLQLVKLIDLSFLTGYVHNFYYTLIGQVVAALLATDCFMCTVVQNHQATSIILRLVLIPLIL